MMRQLHKRLARLEVLCQRQARGPIRVVMIWHSVKRNQLAEGQRIVVDEYRWARCVGQGRERITSDPEDEGRCCEPGRCLEDIVRELGEECQLQADGTCPLCPIRGY